MKVKFLDLKAQYDSIRSDIDAAVARILDNCSFIGGPDVAGFEAEFAEFQHAEHCVGVANGTDAIEIAIEALQLERGSEILVPANSFIASSEAVSRGGHSVVFCEPTADQYTIDPEDVARRITERTAAIIGVHLYGNPCDMTALRTLADRHRLAIIEDAAQAHGAEWQGRRVGAIGDIGTFSFYPGKNLGAYGDAGAIVTNNSDLAKRCRMIANHGRIEKYNHLFEGRNSRLDGLQAAVLRVKLRSLDSWVSRRNEIAFRYRAQLGDVTELVLPGAVANARHAYHLFVVRTPRRDELKSFLAEQGIETGIHYPIALPDLPAYQHMRDSRTPQRASELAPQLLSLPIGEHLSDEQVDYVCAAVRAFFHEGVAASTDAIAHSVAS